MTKSNILMLSITIVALFVIVTFSLTYSFFTSKNLTDRSISSVNIGSGKMYVEFEDNNPDVTFSNVIPGPTNSVNDAILVKKFTISGINNTDLKMEYALKFKVVQNTFEDNDIGYILIGDSKTNGAYVTNSKSAFKSTDIMKISSGNNIDIDLGNGYFENNNEELVSHVYSFYLFYIETGEAQNSQDASFSGYITLTID